MPFKNRAFVQSKIYNIPVISPKDAMYNMIDAINTAVTYESY